MFKGNNLARLPALIGHYSLLSVSQVASLTDTLMSMANTGVEVVRKDISRLDIGETQSLLRSLRPLDTSVLLLWPADKLGIEMDYSLFVENYDDMWYPSREDLWVTDHAYTWLIEFDHEEILRFVLPRSE